MAQKTQILLVDDVDGSPADVTVQFALDGVGYEIDLSDANAEKLRSALAPWLGHARKVGRKPAPATRSAARSRTNATDIRRWAREQGHTISDRGRVAAEIRAAYEAAH
jgi:hypothetical protein